MWLSSPTPTPPPLTCPPHIHTAWVRAVQLTAVGAADTCYRWAGLAAARKPECSAPRFPHLTYTPAAHLLREISSRTTSAGLPESHPLVTSSPSPISHAPSHFPLWYGTERPQRWRKPLSLSEPHEILDLTHVESPRLPRCQRFRPWELEKFSETI